VSERNRETIRRFYAAFDAGDAETMAACYSPDVHFSDPVFPDLNGGEAADMWRMLTGRAEDLSVELAAHDADQRSGPGARS
jgi:ketosteroid isomerase-like protein